MKQSNEIWGWWECPVCLEILQDPNSIINTICHENHEVTLTLAEENGDKREAFKRFDCSSHNK